MLAGLTFQLTIDALRVINKINQTLPRTPPPRPITTAQKGFKVRLATTDASGNPLDTMGKGETFLLQGLRLGCPVPVRWACMLRTWILPFHLSSSNQQGRWIMGWTFPTGRLAIPTPPACSTISVESCSALGLRRKCRRATSFSPCRFEASRGEVTFVLQETASYGLLFGIDPFVTTDPTSVQIRVVPEPSGCLLCFDGWVVADPAEAAAVVSRLYRRYRECGQPLPRSICLIRL